MFIVMGLLVKTEQQPLSRFFVVEYLWFAWKNGFFTVLKVIQFPFPILNSYSPFSNPELLLAIFFQLLFSSICSMNRIQKGQYSALPNNSRYFTEQSSLNKSKRNARTFKFIKRKYNVINIFKTWTYIIINNNVGWGGATWSSY